MNVLFNMSDLRAYEHRAELVRQAERHRQAREASRRATKPRRHPAGRPSTERPLHPMFRGVMSAAAPGLRQPGSVASWWHDIWGRCRAPWDWASAPSRRCWR
jgi:hypothetical protein